MPPHSLRFAILLSATFLSACGTPGRPFKAGPAELSPFMEDQRHVRKTSEGPFHYVWTEAKPAQLAVSDRKQKLCILPVESKYLRPISKRLARAEYASRPTDVISRALSDAFADAFRESKAPRFRLVDTPGPDTLTLKLALVELNPTSVRGNVVKKAAGMVLTPAVGLAGRFTRGSIAIEGKLRDATGGWLVLQFADREQDKMTFWSLRDFRPYGHSRVAIKEWARQFERLTRTPDWEKKLHDADFFTLSPF